MYIYVYIYIFSPLTDYFEVAIESWPEWDLNPRPLNDHEFNSNSEPTLYSHSNFIACSVSSFISAIAFASHHVYF